MIPIILGVSWLVGVVVGQAWPIDPRLPLLLIWLALLSAVCLWRLSRPFFVPLVLALFLLGTLRGTTATAALDQLDLIRLNDGPIPLTLQGTIDDQPDNNGSWTNFTLGRVAVLQNGTYQPVSGRVKVSIIKDAELKNGDLLRLTGLLQSAPVIDAFPYREYLLRQGIATVVENPAIKVINHGQMEWYVAWLGEVRKSVEDSLARSMPLPQSAIAQGALLGSTQRLSADLKDAFNRTSTSHVLAVSGFNIAVLASLTTVLLRRVRHRKLASIATVATIAAYAVLVGAEPSAVRAALMGGLIVIGDYFGRPTHTIASLLLVASAMTAVDPLLIGDIGFQLSFLATGGLVVLTPIIARFFARLPRIVGDGLAMTIAAQLGTLPVIAVNFQQISLLALPANLLVLPALPAITILSIVTALAGIIHPMLGVVVGYVPTLFASYLLLVVESLGQVTWAVLPTGQISEGVAIFYYFCLAVVLLIGAARRRRLSLPLFALPGDRARRGVVVILGTVLVVSWTGAITTPGDDLSVAFLNVGQGDAILVRAAGHNVLVDGGPDGETLRDALDRRLPFFGNRLDLVILTHSDADHVGGLPAIFDRYQVGQVLQPKAAISQGVYGNWLALLEQNHVPVTTAEAGQVIRLDEKVSITILSPPHAHQVRQADDNEGSVVAQVRCGQVSILLTGDSGVEAQQAMLNAGSVSANTVLKVPHHGAAGGLDPRFLAAVHPQIAVLSVGRDNRYGHPDPSIVKMLEGSKLYRTDIDGTVTITVQGDRCNLSTSSH